MWKKACTLALALTFCALAHRFAAAKELVIGDPAPDFTVQEFVKGDPITKLEKGKVYVIDFWSTKYPPVQDTIPHLTALAKQHKNVIFIGVDVFEPTPSEVAPFVQKMGAKMDYRVALDDVPHDKGGVSGAMATNWVQAAHQQFATTFVVDKEGRIAWHGSALKLDAPLGKIVADKWDLKAETAKDQKEKALDKKMMAVSEKAGPALQTMDWAKVVSLIDESVAADPDLEPRMALNKVGLLRSLVKDDQAAAYGDKLVTGLWKDDAEHLNELAWSIVDPASPPHQPAVLVAMALKAALRADEVSEHKDAAITDTLAAAYFASGKKDKAVETETRALTLARGSYLEKDINEALEKYKFAN